MGLLEWLGVRPVNKPLPDMVWSSAAAKFEGIGAQARQLRSQGSAVVVAAHFVETLRALEQFLSASGLAAEVIDGPGRLSPTGSRRRDPLRLLHAGAFCADANPKARDDCDVYVLVVERHPLRARDEELVGRAAPAGSRVRVCFHVSLDDPFLSDTDGGARARDALVAVGDPAAARGAGVSHPLACRAVALAQAEIAARACGDAQASSAAEWLQLNCRRAAA